MHAGELVVFVDHISANLPKIANLCVLFDNTKLNNCGLGFQMCLTHGKFPTRTTNVRVKYSVDNTDVANVKEMPTKKGKTKIKRIK